MALSRVEVVPGVLLTCTAHALTTETEEVMGLLLGNIRWEDGMAISRIWHAMPQIRTDRRKDRVEPSHEQLSSCIGIADKMTHLTGVDTKIVGWYHSHPNITVQPSHVDLRTQAQHQALDDGFVGLIFSCFNKDQKIRCTAFQSILGPSEVENPAVLIEDEDPDMREALKLSLADSQQTNPSATNWRHKEVPMTVSKEWGDWERSFGDIMQLQEMLLVEEKSAHENAIQSDVSTPLSALNHGAMYLQSLSRVMDLVLLPSVRMLQQTVAQNKFQAEQLDAELTLLRARKLSLCKDPVPATPPQETTSMHGSSKQLSDDNAHNRISEAEFLINVGKRESTRNQVAEPHSDPDTAGISGLAGAGGVHMGRGQPPPGFSQARMGNMDGRQDPGFTQQQVSDAGRFQNPQYTGFLQLDNDVNRSGVATQGMEIPPQITSGLQPRTRPVDSSTHIGPPLSMPTSAVNMPMGEPTVSRTAAPMIRPQGNPLSSFGGGGEGPSPGFFAAQAAQAPPSAGLSRQAQYPIGETAGATGHFSSDIQFGSLPLSMSAQGSPTPFRLQGSIASPRNEAVRRQLAGNTQSKAPKHVAQHGNHGGQRPRISIGERNHVTRMTSDPFSDLVQMANKPRSRDVPPNTDTVHESLYHRSTGPTFRPSDESINQITHASSEGRGDVTRQQGAHDETAVGPSEKPNCGVPGNASDNCGLGDGRDPQKLPSGQGNGKRSRHQSSKGGGQHQQRGGRNGGGTGRSRGRSR